MGTNSGRPALPHGMIGKRLLSDIHERKYGTYSNGMQRPHYPVPVDAALARSMVLADHGDFENAALWNYDPQYFSTY